MYNKLDNISCEEIIIKYNSGTNKNILSKEYKVSHKTISNIIDRNGRERLKGNQKYSVNEDYFKLIDCEEKAYWLGFMYADGYIIEKNSSLYAGVLIKDREHLEKFKVCIESNNPIKNTSKHNNYTINISNKKFCENLITQGCVPRKTFLIKFPILRDDLKRHFIRGFFDGDGSITCSDKTLQITICCASNDFINELVNELYSSLELKRIKKIYIRKDGLLLYVNSSGEDIILLSKYFYDNSNIYLERKKEIFDKVENNLMEIKSKIWKNNWENKKNKKLSILKE